MKKPAMAKKVVGVLPMKVKRVLKRPALARVRAPKPTRVHLREWKPQHTMPSQKPASCGHVFAVHCVPKPRKATILKRPAAKRAHATDPWPDMLEFVPPRFGAVWVDTTRQWHPYGERTDEEAEEEDAKEEEDMNNATAALIGQQVVGIYKTQKDATCSKAKVHATSGAPSVVGVKVFGKSLPTVLHVVRGVMFENNDGNTGRGACLLGAYADKAMAEARVGEVLFGIRDSPELSFLQEDFVITEKRGTDGSYRVQANYFDCAGSVECLLTVEKLRVK